MWIFTQPRSIGPGHCALDVGKVVTKWGYSISVAFQPRVLEEFRQIGKIIAVISHICHGTHSAVVLNTICIHI